VDDDVAALAREERLLEAGALAAARGDHHTASVMLERACEWGEAASAALAAKEPGRALLLAALGDSDATARAALDSLAGSAPAGELIGLATALARRGNHAWAARTFEVAGATNDAADAWERAGDALQAARVLESLANGQGVIAAARRLEAALRLAPDRADLRVALGRLLIRCGKPAAALRALQRVPEGAPEERVSLALMSAAANELGMSDAKAEVDSRLAALKGAPASPCAPDVVAEQPRAPALPRLYGRYEIVREVSSTATARVVECQDAVFGERVAVKIFSAAAPQTRGAGRDALARFSREAKALAALAHPNIVPLRDIIEHAPALVLAWMPGGTLEERLAIEVFAPSRAADVARAVLSALGEAHRLGILHRDIKPANILFDAAGNARLSDFGVAHLGDLSVTATAGFFGSLAYMSPEQREGRPATARSDLFGVGVVLFEMLTGKRPAPHEPRREPLSAYHRHLDLSHEQVVGSLLAQDPALRPPDAFAALRSIDAIAWPVDTDPTRDRGPTPGPASVHPPPERLAVAPDELHARDLWVDRPVARIPLDARSLARASAFARVGDRALQPVLRVDHESATLWLGVPRAEPLLRSLHPGELLVLEAALERLHATGFVHGAIDRAAILVGTHGPVLLFPTRDNENATAKDDRAALRSL